MLEVIPSLGTKDKAWGDIKVKLESSLSFAKTVHVDIIDGKFADNRTFLDPRPFLRYKEDFFLEAHLMVDNPIDYISSFASAGFKRFIGQIEKMPDVAEFVSKSQLLGEVGLAIDVPTDISSLTIDFDNLDCLLVMTVKAGFSGQVFLEDQLFKIKELREKTAIPIEVDGGINDSTILKCKEAGASRFASASFLWESPDPRRAFQELENIVLEK